MLRWKPCVVFIVIQFSCGLSQLVNFLMYDKEANKCLKGYQPVKLFYCDSNQLSQQFRWASDDRILNVNMKKCLGAGSKVDGSGLQWYICDEKSDLQKWTCTNDTLLSLKGQDLFISQDRDSLLTLTKDVGAARKWLIHGTTDSLCSLQYQELYTLDGTARGQPCSFPFLYNGKWYSECTLEKSTNRYWCSVDKEYQERWGYCPSKTVENWKQNPVTGVLYKVHVSSALTWYQARTSCQQQDADLLSLTEPQEQTFISGITNELKTIFWIGLNQLEAGSGWQWVNGDPYRYLRWGPGQPYAEQGWSCGCLSTQENNSWQNRLCSKKHGYICQKGAPKPTVPPGSPVSCTSPWLSYAGHCYYLNRTRSTWKEANTKCSMQGGNLASILNIEEHSFVLSQLGYRETDQLWIGLNDLKTRLLFEWSDHSPVTFSTWAAREPSHHLAVQEHCVRMGGKEGKWSDDVCERKFGFICKKAGDSTSSGQDAPSQGCKSGWVRHGYNCYFAGSQAKTFDEAQASCKSSGARLVDVQNSVENAFLVSLVGARGETHFWIGLSNRKQHYMFEWTNSPYVPYTHWNTHMPGRRQGCVAMTTGVLAGLWNVLSCSSKEKYICKQWAEGAMTTLAPPTPSMAGCAEGWKPLGQRHTCYKFYSMDYDKTKSWFEALDFCRSLGGDLVSIHSPLDHPHTEDGWRGWIGYSAQDPSVGYTWSDGTASSYTNWKSGEPNNEHNMENCAAVEVWSSKWVDIPCEKKQDFICEIQKGVTPETPANATAGPEYNTTEDGWVEFGGHQYYFAKDAYDSMDVGRTFCKRHHGDLVVIETEAERIFLWKQITYHWNLYYIGMIVDLERNMLWMDGSPVVLQRWFEDEPADEMMDESCVIMDHDYGLWRTSLCGRNHGYICERHEAPPVNTTVAPTAAPKGGCAPGWTQYKHHCYKMEFSPKTWKDARTSCKGEGGNLVSILSLDEQAFLTTAIIKAPSDMWIGLRSVISYEVMWADRRAVVFANYYRQRKDGYSYTMPYWQAFYESQGYPEEICYKMMLSPSIATGQWRPANCNDTNGYICKRPVDSQIPPAPSLPSNSYVKLGNDSLKLQSSNLSWWEAKRRCEAEGGHLASIRDTISQAFIELQVHQLNLPTWIGLNKNETGGYYKWIDGWPLNLEKWDENEPQTPFACVFVNLKGNWQTALCNESLPSVCKKSPDLPPTPETHYEGVCPESSANILWVPFKGHCYMINYDTDGAAGAMMTCAKHEAALLSIQDTDEARFINGFLELDQDSHENFQLGLYKNLKGQWHWVDGSVLDFTDWAQDYPQEGDNHAYISTTDFKWRSESHSWRSRPYICKRAKAPLPVDSSTASSRQEQEVHRRFATAVVITIVVLGIFVAISFFVYQKGYKGARISRPTFDNPLYFKVSNPVDLDNKNLINDVEPE